MRQLLLLGSLLFWSVSLSAQSTSVVVLGATTDVAGMTNNVELRNELQGIVDNVLRSNTYGSLGCRLEFLSASSQRISGMAKRTVKKFQFSLSFTDYVLEIPVGEMMTGIVSGSGGNDQEACTNALRKLSKTHLSRERLVGVIKQHRDQLPDCETLISRLEKLNNEGNNTAVLAVHAQMSDSDDCAASLEELVSKIYKQQQATDCRKFIIRAKAEVVAGNMSRAARLLASVDPTLDCAVEAEALLDELMKKDTIRANLNWYSSAYRNRSISTATRRRIISNLVLEYAYQNY